MAFLELDPPLLNFSEFSQAVEPARKIAFQCLKSNIVSVSTAESSSHIQKKYLLAGGHQYRSLWARDLAMSVRGAMAVGEVEAVRESLGVFFSFQRSDGLLPRVMDYYDIFRRVTLGIAGVPLEFKAPLRPWFTTENRVISIDGNLALAWAGSYYVQHTRDYEFAREWFLHLEKAIGFVEKHFLIGDLVGNQPPFGDWTDSIRRTGRVAFTNELYVLALEGISAWADFIGESGKATSYKAQAAQVRESFLRFFWNPERKILLNFEGDGHWTADANLFAVAHSLIPDDYALELMEQLRSSPLWDPFPGRPTWPEYPAELKSWLVKAVRLGGYHDQYHWLWLTSLASLAEKKTGNSMGYISIVNRMAEQVVADQMIHEVYELKSKNRLVPVRRLFYRSERPFTWSAALFLEALA